MRVSVGPTKWGKKWVKVQLLYSRMFMPSFEDLFRIIQAVSYCEEEKYPNGKGKDFVAEFLRDCVYAKSFEELAERYRIPYRCGEKVIDRRGASYNPDTMK